MINLAPSCTNKLQPNPLTGAILKIQPSEIRLGMLHLNGGSDTHDWGCDGSRWRIQTSLAVIMLCRTFCFKKTTRASQLSPRKKKKHKTTRLQTRSISIPSIAGSLVALFLANLRPVKSAPNLSHLSPILRDLRNPVPYPNQKQVRDLDVSPSPSHVPDVKDLKTLPYNTVTTLSSFVVGWVSRYIDP